MAENIKNPEFISDGEDTSMLIQVHINKARNAEYFYGWSSNAKGWIREEKIPEHLNKMYNTPHVKSNYK